MPEFNEFFQRILEGEALSRAPNFGLSTLLLSLLLAFCLGQMAAWVYAWTHGGLSYSRGFTQSLVLLVVVAALVMYVIGDSLVAAFGLIGALAIIRFRNALKDTRDTVFVFASLILGMACGSQRYAVAVFGAFFLLAVALYLNFVSFGGRGRFDANLSYRIEHSGAALAQSELAAILRRFCRSVREVTRHVEGDVEETICAIRLRDRRRSHELVEELRELAGVRSVQLLRRDLQAEL